MSELTPLLDSLSKGRDYTTRAGTVAAIEAECIRQGLTLKAQIATLTEREKQLKAALVASGYAALEGNLYRAAITWTERATLDGEAVRALLTEEQVRQCTKMTEVMSVRVSARKRNAA